MAIIGLFKSLKAAPVVGLLAVVLTVPTHATEIVNDSFADGDRAKTGALDTNWWTSSSSSGIEIAPGALGLVTGTSGRGIHTVFPTQSFMNVGDELVATYTFTTPATVRQPSGSSASFRVGFFDSLGRAGLDADVSASSSSPNPLYGCNMAANPNCPSDAPGIPGYMMDMDVNTGPESDIQFRSHATGFATGRLMATTGNFSFNSLSPSGPDGGYTFDPNTQYTGSLAIKMTSATEYDLTGSIGSYTYTLEDVAMDTTDFDFFGFHVNSNIFGSTNSQGEPDNGIDFSNITIEFNAVPEPSTFSLLGLVGLLVLRRRQS